MKDKVAIETFRKALKDDKGLENFPEFARKLKSAKLEEIVKLNLPYFQDLYSPTSPILTFGHKVANGAAKLRK